jgi:hypothetical protein
MSSTMTSNELSFRDFVDSGSMQHDAFTNFVERHVMSSVRKKSTQPEPSVHRPEMSGPPIDEQYESVTRRSQSFSTIPSSETGPGIPRRQSSEGPNQRLQELTHPTPASPAVSTLAGVGSGVDSPEKQESDHKESDQNQIGLFKESTPANAGTLNTLIPQPEGGISTSTAQAGEHKKTRSMLKGFKNLFGSKNLKGSR